MRDWIDEFIGDWLMPGLFWFCMKKFAVQTVISGYLIWRHFQ